MRISCVWFGFGRNKLVQLLIRVGNIFGRTVQTLSSAMQSLFDVLQYSLLLRVYEHTLQMQTTDL